MTSAFLTIKRDSKEIECEITGAYQSADPDCGIMRGYVEEVTATSLETKEQVELTEEEEERAIQKLIENAESDWED